MEKEYHESQDTIKKIKLEYQELQDLINKLKTKYEKNKHKMIND
jgi:predicted nuclease with TOPRIM domain